MSNDITNPSLSSLTSSQMLSAQLIYFQNSTPNGAGWNIEASVSGFDQNALLHSTYKFNATEGDTIDIFSVSFFDPYTLRIYDQNGNALVANSESNDPADFILDGIGYGVDFLEDYVATYTGTYYVEASWNQGSAFTFYDLMIYIDTDTTLDQKADAIFDWAETEYPSLFIGNPYSEDVYGYHARFYENSALGEINGDIYFYDAITDIVMLVGTVNDFPV